jgi:hypothetical protein
LENQAKVVQQWFATVGDHFNVEQKKALLLSGDLLWAGSEEQDGPPVIVKVIPDGNLTIKEAMEHRKKIRGLVEGATDANVQQERERSSFSMEQ